MSSEVCPFCGKPFKRLKSHLPHCKAAERSKPPPTQHDVTVSQRASSLPPLSSQPTSALAEKTPKSKKATPTLSSTVTPQTKKSKKVSALPSASLPLSESSSPATPLKSANTSSSSLSLSSSSSPSSTSLSASTKKKKQKLVDQIKMAAASSSSTISVSSSPSPSLSPSPSPSLSKPKKKSLRTLIEAAKSNPVPEGSPKETKSTSQDLLSVSTPFSLVTDPLTSRTSALTGTTATPDKDPDTQSALLSPDPKPKGSPKKKASQREKAAQSLSATRASSVSQDSKGDAVGNSAGPNGRDGFWEDGEGKTREDISGKESFWGSGSGHQARITLQDVKATLGRSNKTKTRGPLSTSLSLVSVPALNQNEHGVSRLLTPVAQSDRSPNTGSQDMELSSVKSKRASLIPPQDEGSSQPKPTSSLLSPVTPLLAPLSTTNTNKGLNMDYHKTGLLSAASPSITPFMAGGTPPRAAPSSCLPRPLLLPPQTLPLRVNEGLVMEEIRKQNVAGNGIGGVLTQRSLGQVRLRELPGWLALKTPSHPREAAEILHRGWQWYYRRYIDVRKGGVGGVAMLLAGYCVLSYMWSYPHIKRDRWRKYH
ncbi:uncharacterized protein LOC139912772 isoform X1 [Centroberyx gerrardi]